MENASKALIIAGAVLIAIMIISLGVYMFNKMGGAAREAADMDEQAIAAFNSKITPYLGNAVAGSQVNALLQYCLSSNQAAKQANETYKYITVNKSGTKILDENTNSFKRLQTSGTYYTVEAVYSSDGLITTINIK